MQHFHLFAYQQLPILWYLFQYLSSGRLFVSLLRVFHTVRLQWKTISCVSLWYFTEEWFTASLLKSPGLISLFWPISTIRGRVESIQSPLVLFSSPSFSVLNLWWLYRAHQLQLVSQSLSCSIVFRSFSMV